MAPKGLLFDKDGTLFDFRATWDHWAGGVLTELAEQSGAELTKMADAMGYDLNARAMLPGSVFIAGTNAEVMDALLPFLPGWQASQLEAHINACGTNVAPVSPVPLAPYFTSLREMGYLTAVVTNDSHDNAVQHLAAEAVTDHVDVVIGYDSGFTPKPAPDMCLAAADKLGIDPGECVMIGDSTHDLFAGQDAGMATVAVLTGVAGADVLGPHADVVLQHIGHLPAWLDA